MRILLAEDSAICRRAALRQLTARGVSVDAAEDGVEALELFEANAYDAVITDLHMPRMGGLGLCSRIRRAEARNGRRCVIVAVTADASDSTRRRALVRGFDAFLAKPLRLDQLGAVLGYQLAARERLPRARPGARLERLFSRKTREQLAVIAAALKAGDLESLAGEAHSLAGAAATLGRAELAEAARALAGAARGGGEAAVLLSLLVQARRAFASPSRRAQ